MPTRHKNSNDILLNYHWLKKYKSRLSESADNTWDIVTALPDFNIIGQKESREYSVKINDIYREISYKIEKGLLELKDQLPEDILVKENYSD